MKKEELEETMGACYSVATFPVEEVVGYEEVGAGVFVPRADFILIFWFRV